MITQIDIDCHEFTTILQWPNFQSQPYPLAPYGGPQNASVPDLESFLTESTYSQEICGGPAGYPPTTYCRPLAFEGNPGAGAGPSSRARSVPSGSSTRRTRGNSSSARGKSQGKKKEQAPSLNSFGIPDLGMLAPLRPTLSLPSRSIPRSGRSRNVKPYDNPEQVQEIKDFNDTVWDLAKQWFVLKLWRESCFFLHTDSNKRDKTVDRCATEAYEAAISEYRDTYPDRVGLITKYRLQPQDAGVLVECHQVVSCSYHNLYGYHQSDSF